MSSTRSIDFGYDRLLLYQHFLAVPPTGSASILSTADYHCARVRATKRHGYHTLRCALYQLWHSRCLRRHFNSHYQWFQELYIRDVDIFEHSRKSGDTVVWQSHLFPTHSQWHLGFYDKYVEPTNAACKCWDILTPRLSVEIPIIRNKHWWFSDIVARSMIQSPDVANFSCLTSPDISSTSNLLCN